MGRTSESSDAASTYSDSSTLCSFTKDGDTKEAVATPPGPPRGVRQRIRDVVADLGHPPTVREDARQGRPPKNHVDVGPIGTMLVAKPVV